MDADELWRAERLIPGRDLLAGEAQTRGLRVLVLLLRIRRIEDYGDSFGAHVVATDGSLTLASYRFAAELKGFWTR